MKYLVIDIGGTFTKYAVMDEICHFYKKDKIATVQDNLENFIAMLVQIYEENSDEICGIALSTAGVIDSDTGFMYTGGSIFCVSNINIVEILEKRCGVPVTVENDAKCAALAEIWRGALADCQNAIVVICGTAIGGAVIYDRKVLKGKNFLAGEFSYILTDSKDVMNRKKILAEAGGVPRLIEITSARKGESADGMDGEEIFALANCGDEEAIACIREYAGEIAVQLTNYQFMFDPERIAIGGGISVQPLFLQMIKAELKRINRVYPHELPLPDVTTCQFFNDSNLIGALYVHLRSKEEQINIGKVKELMEMVQDRREGQYLRELLIGK